MEKKWKTLEKMHLRLMDEALEISADSSEENFLSSFEIKNKIAPKIRELKLIISELAEKTRRLKDYYYLLNITNNWNNFIAYHGGTTNLIQIPYPQELTNRKSPKKNKILKGTVISISGNKTIKCEISIFKQHKKYKKFITRKKKYMVHDENNRCSVGDEVIFTECRPFSKTKHHRLLEITSKINFYDNFEIKSGSLKEEEISIKFDEEQEHKELELV